MNSVARALEGPYLTYEVESNSCKKPAGVERKSKDEEAMSWKDTNEHDERSKAFQRLWRYLNFKKRNMHVT